MAGQMQLIFLSVIVALVQSNDVPLAIAQNSKAELKMSGDLNRNIAVQLDKDVNLNKAVDYLLPFIRTFILDHGMDPMDLVDISEPIFPDLPGKLKGNLDLKKGWLQNLSHLERSKDVTATYKDKILTLNANLRFDTLDFNYNYALKYLLYSRKGEVFGRFYNIDINTEVTIDLNNYVLILNSIKFSEVDKYEIKFEGRLLDPILNVLTKIITVIFKGPVLQLIEKHSATIFGAKIDEWNTLLPRPTRMQLIEDWLNT